MISDKLSSTTARALERAYPVLERAFAWIEQMPADTPDGRIELGGNDLYVNLHRYPTRPRESCQWESHRDTVDIQYCISGSEIIEWAPAGSLRSLDDYSPVSDVEHWQGDVQVTRIRLTPGMFAIFLPNELHRPQVCDIGSSGIRKLAVKIRAHLLHL